MIVFELPEKGIQILTIGDRTLAMHETIDEFISVEQESRDRGNSSFELIDENELELSTDQTPLIKMSGSLIIHTDYLVNLS